MSGFDPSLIGTWRACPVPGDAVMAAYFELERVRRIAEAEWWKDTTDKELWLAYSVAQAECKGFRAAVEHYCPSQPGYSHTSGHMLMAADMHFDEQEAPE